MNFKKIGLGLAATAAMTTGMAMTEAPAQALDIAPGSTINLSNGILGNVRLNTLGVGSYELDFRPNDSTTPADDAFVQVGGGNTGSFVGANIASLLISPLPHILDLQLTGSPSILTLAAPVSNFLTGIDIVQLSSPLVTDQVAFDLTSFVYDISTGDATIAGIFRTSTSTIGGTGRFTSQINEVGVSSYSLSITAIPTPALLPGLIGMGLAAIRKRKGEQAEQPEEVKA
jgi:hypothetical protein